MNEPLFTAAGAGGEVLLHGVLAAMKSRKVRLLEPRMGSRKTLPGLSNWRRVSAHGEDRVFSGFPYIATTATTCEWAQFELSPCVGRATVQAACPGHVRRDTPLSDQVDRLCSVGLSSAAVSVTDTVTTLTSSSSSSAPLGSSSPAAALSEVLAADEHACCCGC